ncbi:lipoxygenase homology domain-containing protein 1-like isoform X2 [Convolutriloba macropyga]|uniref:lipoxygenase homology domain-containing protein 1-like isoform X2 n=1 Tax=Convolutriloba macropyga TaxID=536237 RepID=UPI003F51C0EC
MPVAYNVPGSGVGVACAMRCDTDPTFSNTGFDPYWVKMPPNPTTSQQPLLVHRRSVSRNELSRSAHGGGGRDGRRGVSYSHHSDGGGGLTRRSVSVMYAPSASFSFNSADKALSGSNRLCRMPEYNPFGDPHLVDYFARKFGVIEPHEPDRHFGYRTNRSTSTRVSSRRRRRSRDHDSFTSEDSDSVDGVKRTVRKMKSSKPAKRASSSKRQRVGEKGDHHEREKESFVYKITVVTGHQPHAGTGANVFVRLLGTEGKMNKYKQLTSKNASTNYDVKGRHRKETIYPNQHSQDKSGGLFFAPSSKQSFLIKHKGADLGDLLYLAIKHDGDEKQDDWFLSEVIVKRISGLQDRRSHSRDRSRRRNGSYRRTTRDASRSSGAIEKWKFPCAKWLSIHQPPDFQAQRKLKAIPVRTPLKTEYEVSVETSDVKDAGTSANAFITLYSKDTADAGGSERASARLQLKKAEKWDLDRGKTAVFTVHATQLGPIHKIKLEHDNTGWSPSWCVERVSVTDLKEPQVTYYAIIPKTPLPTSSTAAEGKSGSKGASGSSKGFKGDGGQQWLCKQRGDRSTYRIYLCSSDSDPNANIARLALQPCKYRVVTKTGNVKGSGTDANVFISLHGSLGSTEQYTLNKLKSKPFKKASEDDFILDCDKCVGVLERVQIGHDNSGLAPGWFLDTLSVEQISSAESTGGIMMEKQTFTVHRWLARDEDDKKIVRDLYCSAGPAGTSSALDSTGGGVPFELSFWTGDVSKGGTGARVYIEMYGQRKKAKRTDLQASNTKTEERVDEQDSKRLRRKSRAVSEAIIEENESDEDEDDMEEVSSGKIWLDGGKFEQGKVELVRIESQAHLSPLTRLIVGHDNSGPFSNWFLNKVVVFCPVTGIEQYFVCEQWLSDSMGDKLLERELSERASWRQIRKRKIPWNVIVKTSEKVVGAGTSARVFIQVYGTPPHLLPENKYNKDRIQEMGVVPKSEECQLSTLRDKDGGTHTFDPGATDRFKVALEDVGGGVSGSITKLRIWHDDTGYFAGWMPEKIEMVSALDGGKERYEFLCNKWLSTDEDYHETVRELVPSSSSSTPLLIKQPLTIVLYKLLIKTGSKRGAGTDANVYCTLFGTNGDSGMRKVRHSHNNINKFETGSVEECIIECVDLGQVGRVRIEHDNKNAGAGWYLDSVTVQPITSSTAGSRKQSESTLSGDGTAIVFPCDRWLATDEDDGQCVRDLFPEGTSSSLLLHGGTCEYLVSVKTGTVSGAGTDANVYIHLFGEEGDTGKMYLRNTLSPHVKNKFEQGRTDRFKLTSTNIGKIERLRIGHDGSGMGSGWFLDKVEVEVDTRGEIYEFTCHRWLDKGEMDGRIEIDLYPTQITTTQPKIPIEISVTTSPNDSSGGTISSGCDCSPRLVIYGHKGLIKTPPLTLNNSGSRQGRGEGKFEPGATSTFKFNCDEIGEVRSVRVWLDEEEVNSLSATSDEDQNRTSWHLQKMTITRPPLTEAEQTRVAAESDNAENLFGTDFTSPSASSPPGSPPTGVGRNRLDSGAGNMLANSSFDRRRSSAVNSLNSTMTTPALTASARRISLAADYRKSSVAALDQSGRKSSVAPTGGSGSRGGRYGQKDRFQRDRDREKAKEPLQYHFVCNKWLSLTEGQEQQLVAEIAPVKTTAAGKPTTELLQPDTYPADYELTIHTGVVEGASAEVSLFVAICGTSGDTGRRRVRRLPRDSKVRLEAGGGGFHFTLANCINVGDVTHARVELGKDCWDSGVSWFMDSLSIEAIPILNYKGGGKNETGATKSLTFEKQRKRYYLPCQKWFGLSPPSSQSPADVLWDVSGPQVSRSISSIPYEVVEARVLQQKSATVTAADGSATLTTSGSVEGGATAIRDSLGLELAALSCNYLLHVHTGTKSSSGTSAKVYLYLHGVRETSGIIWLNSQNWRGGTSGDGSSNSSSMFENGQCDSFQIQEAANALGDITNITIGHDGSGLGSGWYLEMVTVESLSEGVEWTFPCGKWLDKDEEDSLTERQLTRVDTQTSIFVPWVPYELKVQTGDVSGASCDADIFTVVYGEDNTSTTQHSLEPNKQLRRKKKRFQRSGSDTFIMMMECVEECLRKVRIGHSMQSSGSGWNLAFLSLRRILLTPTHSVTYVFNCGGGLWLDSGKEDGAIVREFVPTTGSRQETVNTKTATLNLEELDIETLLLDNSMKYEVFVHTGSVSGAGTDANVYIHLFGELGDSGERKLASSSTHTDKFEKGNMDHFVLEAVDLGKLYKLKIRHDNTGITNSSWFLDRVEVTKQQTQRSKGEEQKSRVKSDESAAGATVFHAERWLSKEKSKGGKIECTLYAKGYEGDRDSASTLGGSSMTRSFSGSLSNLNNSTMMSMGGSPRRKGSRAVQQGMEMPIFDGPTVPYTIKVETGPDKDGGTSANAYIEITGEGEKNTTGKLPLILLDPDASFAPGMTDTFSIQAPDVKQIKQITIGHDGVLGSQGWQLKSVEVDMPQRGINVLFPCERWLAKDRDDGMIERTISALDASHSHYKPKRAYEMCVETGDIESAGSDCRVTVQLFGQGGASSTPITLHKREDTLERANKDIHQVALEDIGSLRRMRVSVEPAGARTSWYLQQITMRDTSTFDLFAFKCVDWFDPKRKILKRDLPATFNGHQLIQPTSYVVYVKTSDISFAGTDANVYLTLFGSNGDSDEIQLSSSRTYTDKFERNHTDEFEWNNILSLGDLFKARIRHDNSALNPSWHLHSIEVEDKGSSQSGGGGTGPARWRFMCNKWLSTSKDDKTLVRDLVCDSGPGTSGSKGGGEGKTTEYEVTVRTTDKKKSSSRHHAFITLVGQRGYSTEPLYMVNYANSRRIFKQGEEDKFTFTCENVGKLQSIIIGHLEKVPPEKQAAISPGPSSPHSSPDKETKDWHCYDVTVTEVETRDKWVFLVNQWLKLSKNASNAQSSGNIVSVPVSKYEQGVATAAKTLTEVKYKVDVYTGNEKGAGTDANVFLQIFGDLGDSGRQKLSKSTTYTDKFEKGHKDSFDLQLLDLGKLHKLIIEHDNSNWGAAWFLDKVEITNTASGEFVEFPCYKWLDKSKGDQLIKRELVPRTA